MKKIILTFLICFALCGCENEQTTLKKTECFFYNENYEDHISTSERVILYNDNDTIKKMEIIKVFENNQLADAINQEKELKKYCLDLESEHKTSENKYTCAVKRLNKTVEHSILLDCIEIDNCNYSEYVEQLEKNNYICTEN